MVPVASGGGHTFDLASSHLAVPSSPCPEASIPHCPPLQLSLVACSLFCFLHASVTGHWTPHTAPFAHLSLLATSHLLHTRCRCCWLQGALLAALSRLVSCPSSGLQEHSEFIKLLSIHSTSVYFTEHLLCARHCSSCWGHSKAAGNPCLRKLGSTPHWW